MQHHIEACIHKPEVRYSSGMIVLDHSSPLHSFLKLFETDKITGAQRPSDNYDSQSLTPHSTESNTS
jgi:hypothetical protein